MVLPGSGFRLDTRRRNQGRSSLAHASRRSAGTRTCPKPSSPPDDVVDDPNFLKPFLDKDASYAANHQRTRQSPGVSVMAR